MFPIDRFTMISLEGLYFRYYRNTIFRNLNWRIEDGAAVGLLGKNGAGKSTLLRLIAGILCEDCGVIQVDGSRPFSRTAEHLRNIFLLPEDIIPEHICAIQYAHNYGKFYPQFDLDTFLLLSDSLEVNTCQYLHKMSFGQRKKAMLAFALSLGVKHLLLDEPGNGLDIASKAALRMLVQDYLSPERTIIISTHNVRDIENIVNRISIMDKGKMLFNGRIKTGISDEDLHSGTDLESFFHKITQSPSVKFPLL